MGQGHNSLYKALTKEEVERPRGEGGKIKMKDFRFERGQVVGLSKGRTRQEIL